MTYYNITDSRKLNISIPPNGSPADGTMKDGLYGNDYIHFTGEGYKVAATEIAKILAR